MKFSIDKLVLWLSNGSMRELKFEKDKLNVITGNSKTGKTAILEIIDYCLCGSHDTVTISHEHIGENVIWYGLRFDINDKTYTIARGPIKESGKLSTEYYFSQTGEIPELPSVKLGEQEIKSILESEFSINDDITIAYGGRSVKKDSRLSFRYFLMMNTLSKDVICNGKVFFDKLNIERYREVWPQIFDLASGVIDLESIKILKVMNDLKQELFILDSEIKKWEKKRLKSKSEFEELIKKAKESRLIDEDLEFKEAMESIENLIKKGVMMLEYK